MGFPGAYAEQMLPKILINSLSLLTAVRALVAALLNVLGLARLLEPQICWPEPGPGSRPVSASILQEMLPAEKFSDVAGPGPAEQCAVCLCEFRDHEEIRRLTNCVHIFHRACVDRWMDHDQMTCPLCRTPFVPDELMGFYNERLVGAAAASAAIPEFGGEFSVINNFL